MFDIKTAAQSVGKNIVLDITLQGRLQRNMYTCILLAQVYGGSMRGCGDVNIFL